jgi:hypothetical protein
MIGTLVNKCHEINAAKVPHEAASVAMTVVSIPSTVDSHIIIIIIIIIIFFELRSSKKLQSWLWLGWAFDTFFYGGAPPATAIAKATPSSGTTTFTVEHAE